MLPVWRPFAFALTIATLSAPSSAAAEDVEVYAAGSLRTVVTALHDRAAAMGMDVESDIRRLGIASRSD